jgi:single-stranded DNA-binding protein
MGGEENVKGRVVGVQGQLHEEKWQMHDHRRQHDEA